MVVEIKRPSGRKHNEKRPVSAEIGFSKYAEGSCLIRFGDTHVLCTATVEERVPPFLRGQGKTKIIPMIGSSKAESNIAVPFGACGLT